MAVLWTLAPTTADGCIEAYPSAEGIVTYEYASVSTLHHVQVIDAVTGKITASADLGPGVNVIYVGGGVIFTYGPDTAGCARDMTLGPCIWQVSDIPPWGTDSSVGVFGDNTWVNAGDGVRDWHTGAPAPFGAGDYQCNGPSKDRVLCQTDTDSGYTFQQRNTKTNAPIGSAINPLFTVSFSSDTPTYVTLQDASAGHSRYIGYSWASGQAVFDTTVDGEAEQPDWPVPTLGAGQAGNSFWTYQTDSAGNETLNAFSLTTGKSLWSGIDFTLLGFTSVEEHYMAYAQNDSQLVVFDADTAQPVLTTNLPYEPCSYPDCLGDARTVRIAGNQVVALDATTGTLWVLNG